MSRDAVGYTARQRLDVKTAAALRHEAFWWAYGLATRRSIAALSFHVA